ncbi:hypothetical protein CPB86DRAFT_808363 [Serendipita vermifera]|nr:hypothetical protein CPB86DRAFT_808363 [Serendipita vermifera]
MSDSALVQIPDFAAHTFVPALDLHPLYPTPDLLSQHLSGSATLTPEERTTLVNHSLVRSCTFADLTLLTFLLYDERCNKWVDLELRDEDGATLVSVCIMGFRGLEAQQEERDSERELEREECVRLLVKEGADLNSMDNSDWTPLHHAALLAPASLVSYILSHGASPLALTRRKLTPLDVITAYEDVPGREGAIALLREAMRSQMTFEDRQRMIEQGWRNDERRELERKKQERLERRRYRKKRLKEDVTSVLEEELRDSSWGWGKDGMGGESSDDDFFEPSDLEDEQSDGYDSDTLPTPRDTYDTMLVFSPPALDRIFQALLPLPKSKPIYRRLRDPTPAQALYLHCRFACVACDHNWLEDLLVGAMDRMEEVVMANPNDLSNLTHWLFNATLLLHLLLCDESTSQICEILGLFGLMEEMVNVIYVLIIRLIERRLDPLIDSALLDHTPPELQEEWDALQFEGEWDGWTGLINRVISPKKKPANSSARNSVSSGKMGPPPTPGTGGISASNSANSVNTGNIKASGSSQSTLKADPNSKTARPATNSTTTKSKGLPTPSSTRPSSPPNPSSLLAASNSVTFSSIKDTLSRAAGSVSGSATPANGPAASQSLASLAGKAGGKGSNSPQDVTTLLTALYTFMSLAGVNPVLIIQTFSQVMYWTSCEMFNRILQRKKYLCRSRAIQIGLNLGVLEEWVRGGTGVGLPREVGGHFQVVKELITWLQCLSSIDQFPSLIATVQAFKQLNPLQMRRAVRDYRYEVNESKMTDECAQYLAQLQKDWERQRVKMGVEALKKEMVDREGSVSSRGGGTATDNPGSSALSPSTSADNMAQQAIDNLFSRTFEKSDWQPAKPPAVLGELLDSRHMLPLLLPSDPIHLGALPVIPKDRHGKRESGFHALLSVNSAGLASTPGSRTHSRAGSEAGSRSASRASMSARGAMEWLSRTRKLRRVERTMLKCLGDDEVASELETIAAKWHFAWANSVAGDGNTEDHHQESQQDQQPENKESDQVQEYPDIAQIDEDPEEIETEEITVGSPKLTLEPVRTIKEMRRRSMIQDKH